MDLLLFEFVLRCDSGGITPDEKHIDAFLHSAGKWNKENRERFIKFCFYDWENRKQIRVDYEQELTINTVAQKLF